LEKTTNSSPRWSALQRSAAETLDEEPLGVREQDDDRQDGDQAAGGEGARALLPLLAEKAGRIVVNGRPTGEICPGDRGAAASRVKR